MDIITGFLEGMYYSGDLPSRAESYRIAHYLKSRKLATGTLREVETQVIEAMSVIYKKYLPSEEKDAKP